MLQTLFDSPEDLSCFDGIEPVTDAECALIALETDLETETLTTEETEFLAGFGILPHTTTKGD